MQLAHVIAWHAPWKLFIGLRIRLLDSFQRRCVAALGMWHVALRFVK